MKLISKGAEANIYLTDEGYILKERIKKKYRVNELDEYLRTTRTKKEAKLLNLSKKAGVPSPFVFDVDLEKKTILMSFVEGEKVRDYIEKVELEEKLKICKKIGELVAKLHKKDIIHGDLTTSNMIINGDKIFFIDFGLGEISTEVEDKAVDVLLFKKCLHSSHYKNEIECYEAFISGYKRYSKSEEILKRVGVIERRGRYFAERF